MGVRERRGAENSQVWRGVMRYTWSEWSLITAAVICRARLSSRGLLSSLVSSWVQEGSVEGLPCRQDAGPTSPFERRGPRGGRSRWRSRRPSRPRPERGARAAAGLRPLPGPFLPEHCPQGRINHWARRGWSPGARARRGPVIGCGVDWLVIVPIAKAPPRPPLISAII